MPEKTSSQYKMRLYNDEGQRLYLNSSERQRFETVALAAPDCMAIFALTLLYSGCRIPEALELSVPAVQSNPGVVTFRTLKRRCITFREVPIPNDLAERLLILSQKPPHVPDGRVFVHLLHPLRRITAYRWIKTLMADADIRGAQACPKGLRHGFAIQALQSGVPLNMLQKWMGHANLSTTAIYADACGPEEREIARRMWEV